MITLVDNTPVIFAFVYSCLTNNKVVVSQRHFWNCNEHQMMLCKNSYNNIDINDISLNEDIYLEALSKVINLLFTDYLSLESKARCKTYFYCFHNECLKKLYFSENKPLVQWAIKQSLI